MKPSRLIALALVTSLVAVLNAACSDDESSSAASSCAEAKKVSDSCNSQQPADGGASVTVNFDQAKCESGGDQSKKAADCIVANKSNCDCILKCSLSGSCS